MKETTRILYTVQNITVLSNLRWFDKNQVLLTQMTDEHIMNARCWLYRQISTLKALRYKDNVLKNGYTFSEWMKILTYEEKRRVDEKQLLKIMEIEEELKKLNPQKYDSLRIKELEQQLIDFKMNKLSV